MMNDAFKKITQLTLQVYSGGPFEGGSFLELTGVEEGPIEVVDVEVFDASQRHLREL